MNRNSFLEFAEKRRLYQSCLSDIIDWLESHTDSLKSLKMQNYKGVISILKGMLKHVDRFAEEDDSIELKINENKEVL